MSNAATDVASAKIIIRGTGRGVWASSFAGAGGGPRYVLVKVDRVISGSLRWPYVFANAPCWHGAARGPMLVFLTEGSLGVYQTVNESGILAAAEMPPPATSADPHEAVVAELLEAVKVPALRTEALTQLNTLSPKVAAKAAEEAISDGDPQVRSTANLVLAANGSKEAVRRIVQTLQSDEMNIDYPNDWTGLRYSTDIAKLNLMIRLGMATERLKGEQLRIALPLLKHKNHRVRRSTAYGLRQVKDPSFVPDLLRALEDSDSDVRYNAMMGLCALSKTNSSCGAGVKRFKDEERKYIDMARAVAKEIRRGNK